MSNISRTDVRIFIVSADTDPSTLDSNGETPIKGEIDTYESSGGNRSRTYDPLFGGYSKRDEPRENYELSFDLVLNSADAIRWEGYDMSEHTSGVYTSINDAKDKCIVIEADDGTNAVTYAWNNCFGAEFEVSHSADGTREGSMTFTVPPETLDGQANFQAVGGDHTSLVDWTNLT